MDLTRCQHLPEDRIHETLWIQKECRIRWVCRCILYYLVSLLIVIGLWISSHYSTALFLSTRTFPVALHLRSWNATCHVKNQFSTASILLHSSSSDLPEKRPFMTLFNICSTTNRKHQTVSMANTTRIIASTVLRLAQPLRLPTCFWWYIVRWLFL